MRREITKISDGEKVNLTELSVRDLDRLHYSEETFCAKELKKMPPFSSEREKLFEAGMELVIAIMQVRKKRLSFGVSQATIKLIYDVVRKRQKESTGDKIVFYEAGVGEGIAMEHVSRLPNVSFKGCDVYLRPRVKGFLKAKKSLQLCESTLFRDMQKQPDGSIDVFYADNVFEHLFPDEIDETCAAISRKLKHGAYVILITPNRYGGPHDVSRKFQPKGSVATGFHFMELTYKETTALMQRYGLENNIFLCRHISRANIWMVSNSTGGRILNTLKVWAEPIIFKSPGFISRALSWRGAYDTYVMKKR